MNIVWILKINNKPFFPKKKESLLEGAPVNTKAQLWTNFNVLFFFWQSCYNFVQNSHKMHFLPFVVFHTKMRWGCEKTHVFFYLSLKSNLYLRNGFF